jgi:cobalt/nickel transport system permease protein
VEHGFLDRYSDLDSPAHRLDARVKIIAVVAFVVTVVSTPSQHLSAFVAYAGAIAWTCALARVPVGYVLLRAMIVLPFSLLAALWLPFVGEGPAVVLLGGRLELSIAGLWICGGVVMKSLLGASAVILLMSMTPFAAFLRAVRSLGAPAVIVDLLALTYRYVFVLVGEAMRLRRAAAARGYRPRWLGGALLIGRLVGRLFVRSYERAERVYGAMILRGFDGRLPAARPARFRVWDAGALAGIVSGIVAVRVFVR